MGICSVRKPKKGLTTFVACGDQTQQIPAMKDGLAGLAGLAVVGAAFGAFHPNLHGSWEFLWDDTEHLGRSERRSLKGSQWVKVDSIF
jgi:hypothetical protein